MTLPVASRPGKGMEIAALVVLTAAIHGAQVAELGLYWDDFVHYLQGHHSARGDLVRFVTSDSSGALRSERPGWFVISAVARLAYAWSVPALHALLLVFLAVEAVLVARVAHRAHADHRVASSAGALFLSLPLAPLQTAWAATVHYHGALVLTLLAMLSSERVIARRARSAISFLPAAAAYLGALLTQELFFLLPLAWLVGLAVWPGASGVSAEEARGARRLAWRGLALLLGAALLYALWRTLVLPAYGAEIYSPPARLVPQLAAERALVALRFVVWPWGEVGLERVAIEPSVRPLVGAALAALVFAAALFRATSARRAPSDGEEPGPGRAVARAALLVVAAIATLAIVPVSASKLVGLSRFNFVALPAVALLFAAMVGLLFSVRTPRGRLVRGLAAAVVTLGVAAGALCHGLFKEELVHDWRRLREAFDGIRVRAPALADGTFVVVAGDAFRRVSTHEEMSSLFMALYDNPTLMANDLRRVRVERGALVSVTFGRRAHWFAPREFPLVAVDATEPVANLDPGRLVLFQSRGSEVVAAPSFAIGRARGRVVLQNHPERILAAPSTRSRAWRHLETIR